MTRRMVCPPILPRTTRHVPGTPPLLPGVIRAVVSPDSRDRVSYYLFLSSNQTGVCVDHPPPPPRPPTHRPPAPPVPSPPHLSGNQSRVPLTVILLDFTNFLGSSSQGRLNITSGVSYDVRGLPRVGSARPPAVLLVKEFQVSPPRAHGHQAEPQTAATRCSHCRQQYIEPVCN